MEDGADRAASAMAGRQHGLLTLAQATATGLTPRQVEWRVASGRWQRVRPRVYRVAGAPLSWRAEALAVVLAAGPGAVASHTTAVTLHGLHRLPAPPTFEVTVPPGQTAPRIAGAVVHRTRALPAGDLRLVHGVPSTSGERTLVDLAATGLDDDTVTGLVDDAISAGVAGRARLHRRAGELARGRPGADLLRRLTMPDAEAVFRSWLEREAQRVLHAAGVPDPVWNAPVADTGGRVGVVDALWARQRLVVELDGLRFHSSDARRRADRARDRRLVLAGWRALRYGWLDVRRRPGAFTDQVARALGASPADLS